MNSPCVKQCKLRNYQCVACTRTLDEIKYWKDMAMSERMDLMNQIKGNISTHDCPSCGGVAYCAMEAGKSSNLCWCMAVEKTTNPDTDLDKCLCRSCLTQKESQ